jgi:thioredoxin 1
MSSAAGSNPEAYLSAEPARADIDASRGALLLEFGSPNCGHCLRVQPLIAQALASATPVRRLKIADGSGRPLGRSFGVKLWPTLVFLKDGREITRLVRPTTPSPIEAALAQITS